MRTQRIEELLAHYEDGLREGRDDRGGFDAQSEVDFLRFYLEAEAGAELCFQRAAEWRAGAKATS